MRAFVIELAKIARASPCTRNSKLAILPFENMSSDPKDEYFAHGITDDIATDLSRVQNLSSSRAMQHVTIKTAHYPKVRRRRNLVFDMFSMAVFAGVEARYGSMPDWKTQAIPGSFGQTALTVIWKRYSTFRTR